MLIQIINYALVNGAVADGIPTEDILFSLAVLASYTYIHDKRYQTIWRLCIL